MNLDGLKKSAQLLILLGNEKGSKVLKLLNFSEIENIVGVIINIKNISYEETENILREYNFLSKNLNVKNKENVSYISMLQKALGECTTNNLLNYFYQKKKLDKHLNDINIMDVKKIVDLFKNEHPQVIAMLLMYLTTNKSIKLLSLLSYKQCSEIILRIASFDKLDKMVIIQFSKTLGVLLKKKNKNNNFLSGKILARKLLNKFEFNIKNKICNEMFVIDKNLSKKIFKKIFSFKDIISLSDKDIKFVLQEVDDESLYLSIYNQSQFFKNKLLKNLSKKRLNFFNKTNISKISNLVSSKIIKYKQKYILEIIQLLHKQKKISVNISGQIYE